MFMVSVSKSLTGSAPLSEVEGELLDWSCPGFVDGLELSTQAYTTSFVAAV